MLRRKYAKYQMFVAYSKESNGLTTPRSFKYNFPVACSYSWSLVFPEFELVLNSRQFYLDLLSTLNTRSLSAANLHHDTFFTLVCLQPIYINPTEAGAWTLT
jgi:hypothetical protein